MYINTIHRVNHLVGKLLCTCLELLPNFKRFSHRSGWIETRKDLSMMASKPFWHLSKCCFFRCSCCLTLPPIVNELRGGEGRHCCHRFLLCTVSTHPTLPWCQPPPSPLPPQQLLVASATKETIEWGIWGRRWRKGQCLTWKLEIGKRAEEFLKI